MKHRKHTWHFVRATWSPRKANIAGAEFICDCGKMKKVVAKK